MAQLTSFRDYDTITTWRRIMPKCGECNNSSFFMDTHPSAEGFKLVIYCHSSWGVSEL